MSRSRRPQCSVGRGCGCCGNAGEARLKRERARTEADADFLDEIEAERTTANPKFPILVAKVRDAKESRAAYRR